MSRRIAMSVVVGLCAALASACSSGPSAEQKAYVEEVRQWFYGPATCDQIYGYLEKTAYDYEVGDIGDYVYLELQGAATVAGSSKNCDWYYDN